LGKPQTPAKLAEALKKITSSDWERARAIYVWITWNIAYDANGFFGKRPMVSSLQQAYAQGISVCQGYSDLFTYLASSLGLTCETVSGHAWNKVRIDGQWYLFDATWGAGGIQGEVFRKNNTDAWFAMDPRLFILNHFPEKSGDTLLQENISLLDYLIWPYIPTWQLECLSKTKLSIEQQYAVLSLRNDDFIWSVGRLMDAGFSPDQILELGRSSGCNTEFIYKVEKLRKMGVPAADILRSAAAGQLPQVFDLKNASITRCVMPSQPVRNMSAHFELEGINIVDAALIQNGRWTYFEHSGGRKDGIMSADVIIHATKVSLMVQVAGEGNYYSKLVEWQLR
jgi:hypothetical protein